MDFRPFRALRPTPAAAAEVLAPPYDIVTRASAAALAEGRPDSFLHVSRPDIDVESGADEHVAARRALDGLVGRGVLVQDAHPSYYAYRQTSSDHVQTGLVGLASVADYRSGVIATHEATRADKELDRVRHIGALEAHDEPVFLVARNLPELRLDGVPETAVLDREGVLHEVWPLADLEEVQELQAFFAGLPKAYVADGHHRSAAAARVHDGNPATAGFLAVVLPTSDVRVLSYNRVVAVPLSPVALSGAGFSVAPVAGTFRPRRRHEFAVRMSGNWFLAEATDVDEEDVVERLDVSVLQRRVLGPLLGISDPRTDPRISFVGGEAGVSHLADMPGETAVALHATSVEEMLACADAGASMPPKSTWFDPKLGSGLFVHRWAH